MRKTLVVAAAAAAGLLISSASAASAGSGNPDVRDFYYSGGCTPSGTSLRYNFTNYDINNQSDQQYHVSMVGGTPDSIEFWRGGTFVEITANLRDGYKGFGDYAAVYTMYAYWKKSGGGYYSCKVSR